MVLKARDYAFIGLKLKGLIFQGKVEVGAHMARSEYSSVEKEHW
jgi:hypothetical protein